MPIVDTTEVFSVAKERRARREEIAQLLKQRVPFSGRDDATRGEIRWLRFVPWLPFGRKVTLEPVAFVSGLAVVYSEDGTWERRMTPFPYLFVDSANRLVRSPGSGRNVRGVMWQYVGDPMLLSHDDLKRLRTGVRGDREAIGLSPRRTSVR